eukprot:scaffold5664_cov94-Skeletonema_dohrnii-CCMP3373.AAC.3
MAAVRYGNSYGYSYSHSSSSDQLELGRCVIASLVACLLGYTEPTPSLFSRSAFEPYYRNLIRSFS